MAITYELKLNSLNRISSANLANAVIHVSWSYTGTDEDGFIGVFPGGTSFEIGDINTESFIPYENLTEEIVLGWVNDIITDSYRTHLEERVRSQIEDQRNPVVIVSSNSFPWIVD